MNPLPWHAAAFRDLWSQRDRLPHALLIHGKQGIGKLAFALDLARALLCEKPTDSGACGSCASCGWFAAGSHPDFRWLEPAGEADGEEGESKSKKATQIVIEQVRGLSDFLNVSTHRGGRRPVLIHPAEALNASAANALLKNLEEPAPGTLFLLVTHRVHRLLPTIKSRCRMLALPAPSREAAVEWLGSEAVDQPDLAAAYTGGAPLMALDLPMENFWEQRRRFLQQLASRRIDPISAAEECQDAGLPLVLEWLQKWSYDVASQRLCGRVRYNVDEENAIARLAAACDPVRMLRFHRELVRQQRHAQHPLNARLALEQLLMGYAAAARTSNARS